MSETTDQPDQPDHPDQATEHEDERATEPPDESPDESPGDGEGEQGGPLGNPEHDEEALGHRQQDGSDSRRRRLRPGAESTTALRSAVAASGESAARPARRSDPIIGDQP